VSTFRNSVAVDLCGIVVLGSPFIMVDRRTASWRPGALKKSGVVNPSCIVIEMASLNRVNSSTPDVTC